MQYFKAVCEHYDVHEDEWFSLWWKDGSDIQNELNSSDWQHAFVSRNQTAPLVCASTITEHYTEEQTLLTRKEPKKLIPHWPLTSGTKGAALCAYWGGSSTLYDSIMCVVTHHLSTLLWTPGAPIQPQTDQASLIHLPPRCLCQVIAGGKRKTDQYISHGTDR